MRIPIVVSLPIPHFPDAKCRELYATWLRNSIDGYADVSLVAEIEGYPAGYVTGDVDHGTGRIGIIATAPEHRGRRRRHRHGEYPADSTGPNWRQDGNRRHPGR